MASEQTDPPNTPARQPNAWRADLTAVASASYAWLTRPRVRLTLTGVALLLIGGVFISNSVWTLPLVIVGALMVVTAWIGHRLEGRFVIEWGEGGAELGFRATVKAHHTALPAASAAPTDGDREPATPDVIEGEAHTVEIEVAELNRLIAAAQVRETHLAETSAADIQIRRSTQPA